MFDGCFLHSVQCWYSFWGEPHLVKFCQCNLCLHSSIVNKNLPFDRLGLVHTIHKQHRVKLLLWCQYLIASWLPSWSCPDLRSSAYMQLWYIDLLCYWPMVKPSVLDTLRSHSFRQLGRTSSYIMCKFGDAFSPPCNICARYIYFVKRIAVNYLWINFIFHVYVFDCYLFPDTPCISCNGICSKVWSKLAQCLHLAENDISKYCLSLKY